MYNDSGGLMKKSIIISILLVIAGMGIIFFLSSHDEPSSNKNSMGIVKGIIDTIDNVTHVNDDTRKLHQTEEYIEKANTFFRKLAHVTCYLILTILIFNVLKRLTKKKLIFYNICSFIIAFIYACTDEIHQTFVSGRTGQFTDVLIDSIGIIIGLLIMNYIYKKKNNKEEVSNA